MKMHGEAAFETVLVDHLLSAGYVLVDDKLFNRDRAVFPSVVLDFIGETQPKQWAKLEALHGDVLERDEDEAELWRGKLAAFRNLYSFLSQVIPYQDSDLEKLYTYLRHLGSKLPRRASGPQYSFDDDVRLAYYRLQKISEGSIGLHEGNADALDGPKEVGSGPVHEQTVPLSRLIDVVNERFGTDFTEADQLFFDQIVEAAMSDEGLRQAAQANPEEKFALMFNRVLESLFVERMDQNEDIFARFMGDEPFKKTVASWLVGEVYKKFQGRPKDAE